MGFGTRNGGQIKTFWPDDTPTELWIEDGTDLPDLVARIESHFGDCDMSSLKITSEYVHTDCLGYDSYDADDYTKFLKITRTNNG